MTFIVGLAGSGKSSLLSQLVYDVVFEENFWVSDDDHARNHGDLLKFLGKNYHCVIVERRFMEEHRRAGYEQRLMNEVSNLQVNWIFFENDPDAADYNCRSRPPKEGDYLGDDHVSQNHRDTSIYVIPENGVTIRIRKWPYLSAYHAGDCVQAIPNRMPERDG